MSLNVDADRLASLQDAAGWRGMSVEEHARSALDAASRMDAELAAFVQEGIDAADRGHVVSHAEVEAWFEGRHRSVAAE